MTVLVTPDEMLEAERATIAAGTPGDVLMRRAAESIAGWLNRHVPERDSRARRVVGLIGPGNNGGDALVTLGILASRGWSCQALTVDRERFGALPMSDAERRGILTIDAPDLESADVILDGVYGVRSRTTLSHDVEALFARVNATRSRRPLAVVAVDVPSGIDAGDGDAAPDAIRADVTLCLGLPKLGLTREPAATLTGDLVLIDIGIPPPAIAGRPRLLSPASVVPFLPRRRATAHKHGAGAVLIVGGAPTYYGAPRLAVEAALRAGAGLVAAAVPAAIVPVLATQVPEAVLVPLAEAEGTAPIERFVDDRRATLRAFVVGPGMGRGAFARAMLEGLLGGDAADAIRRLPKVIDADALNWMADLPALPAGVAPGSAVLTPHPGELSRLLGADTTTITADPSPLLAKPPLDSGRS